MELMSFIGVFMKKSQYLVMLFTIIFLFVVISFLLMSTGAQGDSGGTDSNIQVDGYAGGSGEFSWNDIHAFVIWEDDSKIDDKFNVTICERVVWDSGESKYRPAGHIFGQLSDIIWYDDPEPRFKLSKEEFIEYKNDKNLTVYILGEYLRNDVEERQAYQDIVITIPGPTAEIISASPNPTLINKNIKVLMGGNAYKSIEKHVLRLDGNEIYNDTQQEFDISGLAHGDYILSLQVFDDYEIWSPEVSLQIIVHEKPTAVIDSVFPNPLATGYNVTLTGHGEDDGTISRYAWGINKIEVYNDSNPKFEYSGLPLGNHSISFRVEDNFGIWSDEATTSVTVYNKPIAIIESISPNPAVEDQTITLIGNGSDQSQIAKYQWSFNFGSGGTGTHESLSHLFNATIPKAGTFNINLRVKDENGFWSDNVSAIIIVHEQPIAKIDSFSPDIPLNTDNINFIGNGTDDGLIVEYTWYMDSEIVHQGVSPAFQHLALSSGWHEVSLIVKDDHNISSDMVSLNFYVHEKPIANIEEITPNPAIENQNIEFHGNGSDDQVIIGYQWRSSNIGNISTEKDFSKTDLPRGTHIIFLKVKDNFNVWSNETQTILIVHQKPIAFIDSIAPLQSTEGEIITFSGHGTDDESITSYSWRSNIDGVINLNVSFSSKQLSAGIHTIYFKVQDNHGAWSDEVTMIIEIKEKKDSEGGFIPGFELVFFLISIGSVSVVMKGHKRN